MTEATRVAQPQVIRITPPNFRELRLRIAGTAPYMQARFSEKARQKMEATQTAGSVARKGTKREPRDFESDYRGAMHLTPNEKHGIPAAAFRNAMIDACRMVGFKMTMAKMSVFVLADDLDAVDGTPLVLIESVNGPEKHTATVRNQTGVTDIRVRPMWREWSAILRLRFDADQFSAEDVSNLLMRAGVQVGVGEGRPFSKESNGLGFGTFEIVN